MSSTPGSSSSRSPVVVFVGPGADPLDLLAEPAGLAEPLGGPRRRVVEEGVGRLLLVGVLHLGHAQVVVTALEHGERGAAPEHRLDRVGQPGQVVLDQLVLQGEGGGGDHHRPVDEQRRGQVRQATCRCRCRPGRAGARGCRWRARWRRPSAPGRAGTPRRARRRPRRPAARRRGPGALAAAGQRVLRRVGRGGVGDGSCGHVEDRTRHHRRDGIRRRGPADRRSVRVLHMPSEIVRVVYSQVRRVGPPRLSGPPAGRGRPRCLARRGQGHGVGLPRTSVGGADPVRPARAASLLVDGDVQPAAAHQ